MKRLLLFLALALFCLSCAEEKAPEKKEATALPDSDQVLVQHLERLVFDRTYQPPYLLETSGKAPPVWPAWEDIYFERELYRSKLAKEMAKYWHVGRLLWKARINVSVKDELKRGGPIKFVVCYPLIDARDDLVFTAEKGKNGQTIISHQGKFHKPRLDYLFSALLTLLLLFGWVMAALFLGKRLWQGLIKLIGFIADYVSQGQGDLPWARRFAACLVGAAICILATVIWVIIVIT